MGISIHYKGHLNSLDLITPLIKELKDISNIMEWKYTILDEDLLKTNTARLVVKQEKVEIKGHLPLKGIQFIPHPECEPIFFSLIIIEKSGTL